MIFKKMLSLAFLIGFLSVKAADSENNVSAAQPALTLTQALDELDKKVVVEKHRTLVKWVAKHGFMERYEGSNGEIGYVVNWEDKDRLCHHITLGCERSIDGKVKCQMRDFMKTATTILDTKPSSVFVSYGDEETFELMKSRYEALNNQN